MSLAGHFDEAAMKGKLATFYGLKPTTTPCVYATASGQELMLLEVGGASTIFYLRNYGVLHDDAQALPPPKL